MDKVLNEIKLFITKPVTNLVEKENKEETKVSCIKALVVSLVVALVFMLIIMGTIEATFKVAGLGLSSTKSLESLNQAKSAAYASADLFGWFIKVFFIMIATVAVIAAVFFVVAKLLKVNKEFKNSLALAANYAIYIAVALVVYYLFSLMSPTVGAGAAVFVTLFASYAIKYAYRKSLGNEVDDDKLTIFATLVVGVITIVVGIILGNIISASVLSMSSKSLGGYSSLFK